MIKEQIQTAIDELKNLTDLHPQDAAQRLLELSILNASLNSELANLVFAYNKIYREILDSQEKKSVAAAKIQAESSDYFREMNELKALSASIQEIMRAMKILIRVSENDFKNRNI